MVAGLPQRRGESLVTDTAACWRVKAQGSLVIPWRSPCDVLVIPWWSPCGPVAAFICIYHVQPGSRLDDSQKWITEVMGGFYWVDSWLADKTQSLQSQSHCSSSIRPKCFCPRSHMQRCLPRMTTASNWLNRWGLLMPSGTGASCSCLGIEKKKNLKRMWRDSFTTAIFPQHLVVWDLNLRIFLPLISLVVGSTVRSSRLPWQSVRSSPAHSIWNAHQKAHSDHSV